MAETENKSVNPKNDGGSNTILLAVNAVLFLIFIWMLLPRIGIFVQIAITLVPFYLLSHRFSPAIRGTLERILVSFPLASLWLIPLMFVSFFPLFSLDKFAITVLWLLVPAIIALKFEWAGINAGIRKIQPAFSSSRRLAFVLLLSIIVAYSFSGLIASAGLPRTDATAFLNRAVFVKNSLSDSGQIQDWFSKEQLGYPALTFDPPAYYVYHGVLSYLFGTDTPSLVEEFNTLLFVFILLFAIGMFVLCSELFGNDLYGFAAAAVLVTNPYMTTLSLFVGNIKLFSAYAAVPLGILLALRYAQNDEGSGSVGFMTTSALVLGFILMAHFNVFPFSLAIFGLGALVRLFFKNDLSGISVPDAKALVSTVKELTIFAAILFAIILFFIVPPVVYKQYTSSVKFSLEPFNAGAFISNLFGNPDPNVNNYDEKLGVLFGVAFVLGILANIYYLFIYSARKIEWFHILFVVILLAFAILQVLGGLSDIFAQMVVSFIRVEYFLLIAIAIIIASILRITNFEIGSYPISGVIAALLIVLLIASSATVTNKRSISWVTDQFIKSNAANPSPFFANEVKGRLTTYGMYATIIHPGLTIAYGTDTNGMGFIPGQHTDIYQKKLNDIYAGWILPQSTSPEDAYKYYQMTGITTIWANICTPGGAQTVQRFASCVQSSCPISAKQFSQCDVMLFLNASMAKEVAGGSKNSFNFATYNENALPDAIFETISDQKIKIFPQFSSGYILMKQEYFPRWKAVQEGVGNVAVVKSAVGQLVVGSGTVEVVKSDIGLLVVENRNGRKITLSYEFELWEKLLLFVSVVGVVAGSTILLVKE